MVELCLHFEIRYYTDIYARDNFLLRNTEAWVCVMLFSWQTFPAQGLGVKDLMYCISPWTSDFLPLYSAVKYNHILVFYSVSKDNKEFDLGKIQQRFFYQK